MVTVAACVVLPWCLPWWQSLGVTVEGVTASVVKTIAKLAATELPALATFFGGIVAQEVVKYTGAVYRRLASLSPAQ